MRVVMVHPGPAFSVADVYRGWLRALEGYGFKVRDMNYDDILAFHWRAEIRHQDTGEYIRAFAHDDAVHVAARQITATCFDVWPDIVLVVSGFFVPPERFDVIRDRGMKTVLLCTESPYEDDKQLVLAEHADLCILNDPVNLDRFREVQPNTIYLPHAYDPDVHSPGPSVPKYECDFSFVGTGYPSRIRFLEAVDWTDLDVKIGGNWHIDETSPLHRFLISEPEDCIDNDDTVKVYRSSLASANLYRREANEADLAHGWAMGPREVELAATGTFFLRDPRGESDEVLPMLPTFTDPGDFREKLWWWLGHEVEREEAAEKARAAVADRTFAHNAAQMLKALGI